MPAVAREFGAGERLARHIRSSSPSNVSTMTGLADSAMGGVTVGFLSQIFRMDPAAIKRRLVNCPILESRRRGATQVQHLYDLATAAKFLVEPDTDVYALLAKLRREDLPPAISTAYWDALLKKQRFEENAADLWRTEKVWSVLASTFQTLKFTMQLWPENLERLTGLSEEQRELLLGMIDGMQQELYDAMVGQAGGHRTGSQVTEVPENMRVPPTFLDDEDLI